MDHKISTDVLIETAESYRNEFEKIAKKRQEIAEIISLKKRVADANKTNMTLTEYGIDHDKIVRAVGSLPDITTIKTYLTSLDNTIQVFQDERKRINEVIQAVEYLKKMFDEFL